MAVVREDVVKIGFDIEDSPLNDLIKQLDDIKKMVTSGIGDDAFDEMTKDSKAAAEGVEGVKKNADQAREEVAGLRRERLDKLTHSAKELAKTLGTVAAKAGLAVAKMTGLAATGVGLVAKQSVTNYANYEQLVGGVDTIFKDASGTVQKYAEEAYLTAGLSENDFMQTVTYFSGSLIQSLGGDVAKAADYANKAMQDMSDNANKMGTDMSMVQYAYQGFARQNYLMLDNLKLGYGGTKTEMQRLLSDAEKLTGKKYDISSYADIVDAIHAIQENLGITGTTAKEAAETITGSFHAFKGAWSNMLTGLILGEADFDRRLEALITTAKTFMANLAPALTKALGGIGELIEAVAPILESELPALVDSLLPPMIKAAASLVRGLITALPTILKTLVNELPVVLSELWKAVEDVFGKQFPSIGKIGEFFGAIGRFCTEHGAVIKKIVPALIGLIGAFKLFNKIKGISALFGKKSGGAGGGLFGGFGELAKTKTGQVLKGMLNIAIIVGGLVLIGAAIAAVAPFIASLSDAKSLVEVFGIVAVLGAVGVALSIGAGAVGKINVGTVAKGLANIAIMLVGLTLIGAAFALAAPYIAQLSDMKSMIEVIGIIAMLGVVGAGLSILAGIVGAIPIPAVAAGLANIALVLGGFSGVAAAFGALSQISGFNELVAGGGEVLTSLCSIIGEMAGSLVGGFGEGLTSSLPAVAENLCAFATSLQPMFDVFSGVDAAGLGDFAGAMAGFVAVIAGDALIGAITGGIDYAGLGENLGTMATSLEGFFASVMALPEGGFEKATSLFNCLAGISSLPKEGGVVGWFAGEVDYSKMAEGLNSLSGAVGAFASFQDIPQEAFTSAASLFDCLAGIKALPKEGGVWQWFAGTIAYDSLVAGIETLASESFISALQTLSGVPTDITTTLPAIFEALASVKEMPKEGGWWQRMTGDNSTALSNIGQALSDFVTSGSAFFETAQTFSLGSISALFAELSTLGGLVESLTVLDGDVGFALSNMVATVDAMSVELYNSGVSVMDGLNNGMLSMLPTLIATAQSIASAISSAVNIELDIHSPSRVMFKSGVFAGQGLVNGVREMIPTMKTTSNDIARATVPFDNYTPDSGVVHNSSTSSEVYNISPSFSVNISGTQDDRAMARKVKRYVTEAINETFESLERKTVVVRGV